MKRKILFAILLAITAQASYAGIGGPPSIFYSQFYHRGDEVKQDYRNVPGGAQAYEKYSKELRDRTEKQQTKSEISADDISQNGEL